MNGERRGFTLIELLVVIAIIAVLAAILFPMFASAKESGRKTACLNNLMQLGKGFSMYTDVWNKYPGGSPLYRMNSHLSYEWVGWAGAACPRHRMDPRSGGIFPYVNNEQIYTCPSDNGGYYAGYRITFIKAGTGPLGFRLSYSMNNQLDLQACSRVRMPTRTVLLIDEASGSYDAAYSSSRRGDPIVDGYYGFGVDEPSDTHGGGCNFAFCDGHVVWKDSKNYKNLRWTL